MRKLTERAWFVLCLTLGRLLRSVKYSTARIVYQDSGVREVRKSRAFYAPFLVWLGGPLMTLLDTGVRVLPRRAWEERERHVYQSLYGASIRFDIEGTGRTLVLPCLAGVPLAALLEEESPLDKKRVIEWAVAALAEFHRLGFTHGDAMAENVMVDVETGTARWFDFETVHASDRPTVWRRADDLRALLVTCVIRTVPERRAQIVRLIVDAYADEEVTRVLATSFTPGFRPALIFHLAQAGLSDECFQEIARSLAN
jgi:tRNA A-37 threonylcarbamoyl transferase component Bud32